MRRNRIVTAALILVGAAAILGWITREARGANPPAPGVPQPFRIARMAYVPAYVDGVIYNPHSDLYVVIIHACFNQKLSRFYTRLFKADGTPRGGLREVIEIDGYIYSVSVTYNSQDDLILVVGSGGSSKTQFDSIRAGVLDGQGRLVESQPYIDIKDESGTFTGFFPQAAWIAETNQYAVAWSSWNPYKTSDPANGHYLAVLNSDLSFKVKGKQVRRQACSVYQPSYIHILPVGKKILWGGADVANAEQLKPVAWFTRLNGSVLPGYGSQGFIYPGTPVKGGGSLVPAYDPDHDRFLLYWNVGDDYYSDKTTYCRTYFRIMDSKGRFRSGTSALPQKTAFQTSGCAVLNSQEKRFFFVGPEYRILSHGNTWHYGLKLWGFYLDHLGHIEDKSGKDRVVSYPLTDTLMDSHQDGALNAVGFSPKDNSYFIAYGVYDEANRRVDLNGIIYK
jgi:hypothetical protein